MCNVMITDQDKAAIQWLVKRVKSSHIQPDELILCDPADAVMLMSDHTIDIVLAKIDSSTTTGFDLAGGIRRKHLLTIIMGYGSCEDSGFLLKAMRNGITYYTSNIYNTKELTAMLNKAYEQYRRQTIELKLRIEVEKAHSEKSCTSSFLQEWSVDFCRNAFVNNAGSINLYLEYLCEFIDKQSFLSSKRTIIELLVILENQFEKEGIHLPVLPVKEKDYRTLIGMSSVDGLKAWVGKCLRAVAKVAGEVLTADTNAHKLALAIDYINQNYHRDISRDDIAGHIHLNSCYFSQFFKQQMGESFVEYLRRIRMEKAKRLLAFSGGQATEIYLKVGYNDSKYFSRVFREHTGYTPCEYRKMIEEVQFAL